MQSLLKLSFLILIASGTAQAQLASDTPAPRPQATPALSQSVQKTNKLPSESMSDTLKPTKQARLLPLSATAGGKNQQLPSETAAPKSEPQFRKN